MIQTLLEKPPVAGREIWLGARQAFPVEVHHYIGPLGGIQITYITLRDPTIEPPLDDVIGHLNDDMTWTINGQVYTDFWLV